MQIIKQWETDNIVLLEMITLEEVLEVGDGLGVEETITNDTTITEPEITPLALMMVHVVEPDSEEGVLAGEEVNVYLKLE